MSLEDNEALNVISVKSKPYHSLSNKAKPLYNHLLEVCGIRDNQGEAVKWFVTNLVKVVSNDATAMSIKLKASYWSDNDCGIGYRKVRKLIDKLEEIGYIHIHLGYVEYWKAHGEREHRPTVITMTDSLLDRFYAIPHNLYVKKGMAERYVEIRNRTDKALLNVRKIRNLKGVTERMSNYNEALKVADISFMDKPVATVEYQLKYSDDDEHGGRLYSYGGGVQLIKGSLRTKYFKFGGNPVVELDYSAIHPNLCYSYAEQDSIEGEPCLKAQMGEDFCPYGVENTFVEVDQVIIEEIRKDDPTYNPYRSLIKVALLVMINAKSQQQAHYCLMMMFSEGKDTKYKGLSNFKTMKMLRAIVDHNLMIADNFYCDHGMTLQNIDGEIAMRVIEKMVEKKETVLAYHDSFIVQESAQDALEEAMYKSWEEVVGNTKFCKVEEK